MTLPRSQVGAVAKLAGAQQCPDSSCKQDLHVLLFLAWPKLCASSPQARGEFLQMKG